MNTFTHWNIARLSAGAVGRLYPEYKMGKTETLFFCLGSIQPDFSITHWIHRHYYEDSAEHVYAEIKNGKRRGRLSKAFCMGKTAHYLSDFCCFAHTEGFQGSLPEHIAYERRINAYLNANYDRLDQREIRRKRSGNVIFRLDAIIEERKASGESCRKDIEKSIEINLALAEHILVEQPAISENEHQTRGRIDPALV